jgi:hypothetical protein
VPSSDGGSFRIRDERGPLAATALQFQPCGDPTRQQRATHATKQIVGGYWLRLVRRALKMNLTIIFNKRTWECVARRLSWLHPNLLPAIDLTSQPGGSSENEYEYHFH